MRASALVQLTRLSLAQEKGMTVLGVGGIAAGVATLLFFVGLGWGLHTLVEEKIFPEHAPLIEVVPPTVSLFGGQTLDEGQVEQMAHWPHVKAVYRKMSVRVPAASRFSGDFFGAHIRMGIELSAVGVDPGLFAPEISPTRFQDSPDGSRVPAVAATRLVELYNRAYAPARKLPHLSAELLVGFSIPVEFNRSILTGAAEGKALPTTVELVGFSNRAPLVSVAIPLEAARRINRAGGADATSYSGVVLEADSTRQIPALAERARQMGFDIEEGEQRAAEAAGRVTLLTTGVLALLGVLVCGLSAANIAMARAAWVRARERELAVMRAVGASQQDVQLIVLTHTLVLGLGGATLGALGALGGSRVVQALASHALPGLLGAVSLFVWPAWVWVGAMALGVLGAMAGGWIPSRRAAQMDPIQALSSRG